MKKIGTINTHLSRIIASMGHTDRLVICDSGLPIPRGSDLIDLALTTNIPRFLDTLDVVLEELEVEEAIIAEELEQTGNSVGAGLMERLANIRLRKVSHETFKQITSNGGNIAFVRTGEATPYANVILIAGVTFG